MRISLIAGIAMNRAIGFENKLLWHIKEDLQNFKKITMGHHILMGRKTYESIGRPLPGRTNLILSRDPNKVSPKCTHIASIEQGISLAKSKGESELFIIGGEQVYTQCLPIAHMLYLSRVELKVEQADAFFPEFESRYRWSVHHEEVHRNASPAWTFQILQKQGSTPPENHQGDI